MKHSVNVLGKFLNEIESNKRKLDSGIHENAAINIMSYIVDISRKLDYLILENFESTESKGERKILSIIDDKRGALLKESKEILKEILCN